MADEPTGNLDKATGESIIALFKRLASEKGLTILLTTHNSAFASVRRILMRQRRFRGRNRLNNISREM